MDDIAGRSRATGQDRTSAQTQAEIDKGATGEKSPGFDPAAVPLGVDEEAGGVSSSPSVLRHREDQAEPHPNAVEPDYAPSGSPQPRWTGAILVAAAAVVAGMAFLILARPFG